MPRTVIPDSLKGLVIPPECRVTLAESVAFQRRYATATLKAHRNVTSVPWLRQIIDAIIAEREGR